jgi:7SK snRNA methylphosphate capping enzyme
VGDLRLTLIDKCLAESSGKGLAEHLSNALCLDVGCNTGVFARDLVQKYGARRVVGIDIDYQLVTKAIRSIPKEFATSFGFIAKDYVASDSVISRGRYNVIFCMSVTKWVHLNGGDSAIQRLFRRIHAELKSEGLFILEPQEWSTYHRKKRIADHIAENYSKIELRPEKFPQHIRNLGFSLIASQDPLATFTKGFQRKMYVFQKLAV